MGKPLKAAQQDAAPGNEFRRQGETARALRAQLAASFVASEAVIREMRAIRARLPNTRSSQHTLQAPALEAPNGPGEDEERPEA